MIHFHLKIGEKIDSRSFQTHLNENFRTLFPNKTAISSEIKENWAIGWTTTEINNQVSISLKEKYACLFKGEVFSQSKIEEPASLFLDLYKKSGDIFQISEGLNGQFAFILVDINNFQIFCGTDRFSIISCYYCIKDSEVIISTNFNLISSLLENQSIDKMALSHFFTSRHPFEGETFFHNVRKVKPCEVVKINAKTLELEKKKYWDFIFYIDTHRKYEDHLKKILKVWISAIKRRIQTESSITCLLSGGLDSRLNLGTINQLSRNDNREIRIYSKIHYKMDETIEIVKQIGEYFHNRTSHKIVSFSGMNAFKSLKKVIGVIHPQFTIEYFFAISMDFFRNNQSPIFDGFLIGNLIGGTSFPNKSIRFRGNPNSSKNFPIFYKLDKVSLSTLKKYIHKEFLISKSQFELNISNIFNALKNNSFETKYMEFIIKNRGSSGITHGPNQINEIQTIRCPIIDKHLLEVFFEGRPEWYKGHKLQIEMLKIIDYNLAKIPANTMHGKITVPRIWRKIRELFYHFRFFFFLFLERRNILKKQRKADDINFNYLLRREDDFKRSIRNLILEPHEIDSKIFKKTAILKLFYEILEGKNLSNKFLDYYIMFKLFLLAFCKSQ